MKETGQPETFTTITTSKAENLEEAKILWKFTLDRKKRPNWDEAPCPICSPVSPKYLSGFLVWFPKENCIRAIGKECGRTLDKNWHREVRAFKIREEDEARRQYILQKLHTVPQLISEFETELATAKRQHSVWRDLKDRCPAIVQHLRDNMGEDLRVSRRSRNKTLSSSNGTSNYYETRIGKAQGYAAVRRDFPNVREIKSSIEHLEAISHGSNSHEISVRLQVMSKKEQRAIEKVIKLSETKLDRVKQRRHDFLSFFSDANIETINRWATDQNTSMYFTMKLNKNRKCLEVSCQEFSLETIRLRTII
ncbi:hypothetical protein [Leisingera sp. ANG-Vp]|uniref:hypothetical protein n=1 Tax=Leisingera sp. ANG-Vp TaxID=1577896 RepID=UPI00187CF9F3|nr:hypothetical protein [Leisingera sp. ANG-Vp]